MNWFPSFLNIWPAVLAATVAIPALLFLYFLKLRRKEQAVSSTLLWKKAIRDLQVNAPFQKLRRNLLLLLQMLLLLLLLLALARPVTNYTPGAGELTVILIDRSASMAARDIEGSRSRLDEARRQAKALVDTLERDDRAMVIAFDDKAYPLQAFTSDVTALKNAIDSITPTDRPTRLKMAYQLAEAQSNFNPEQLQPLATPRVHVFSDGRVRDAEELRIRGDVIYERIGTEDAGNIALVALSAKRDYDHPGEVRIFARLANFGPDPVETQVQLTVDGDIRSVASTWLAPERWSDPGWTQANPGKADPTFMAKDSVEFAIELFTGAVVKVEQMNKTGDMLPADDAAQVVVPPPRALKALLVTEGNYFLEKAMNSLNLETPATMLPGVYEERKPSDFDVVLFDRHKPRYLPESGSFVYFGVTPDGIRLTTATENGRPVFLDDVGVLDWRREHPILRHLSLGKLYVGESIKLNVPLESEVLVDGLKGPLIALHREGRNTHLVIGFDVLQSNWPLQVSFPIFLSNAMRFLAVGSEMNVRQAYSPGASPVIPRMNLQRLGGDSRSIRLTGPVSQSVTVPETGDFALPPLDRVGVYTLEPAVPQFEHIAVNLLDPNESNLIPAPDAPGGIGEVATAGGGQVRLELWWWIIACLALPLLLIEWWVYTRRAHL